MAHCDYCGAAFRGWGTKHGKYNFCKGTCRDYGAVLDNLNDLSSAEVEAFVEKFRNGLCPSCNKFSDLDFHRSFRVRSMFVYTKWWTESEVSCRGCARKRQLGDLRYCIAFGWWGLPFGPIVTLVQAGRNMIALIRRDTRSRDIDREAKLVLAARVAEVRRSVGAS